MIKYRILWITLHLTFSHGFAQIQVTRANEVLQMHQDPVVSGLAGVTIAPTTVAAAIHNPLALASMRGTRLLYAGYSSLPASDKGVFAAGGWAQDSQLFLGASGAYFYSGGIYRTQEGDTIVGMPTQTFSIWQAPVSLAMAYKWGQGVLGLNLHGVLQNLDQLGLGVRSDLHVNWNLGQWWFYGRLDGWFSSVARWESEFLEYSAPEFYAGIHYEQPAPYFYGSFRFYWQSAGWFQRTAKSLRESNNRLEVLSYRFYEQPWGWFLASRIALEYTSYGGLSLRLGLPDLNSGYRVHAGAGFIVALRWELLYALEHHGDLGRNHRLGVLYRF
jgi:hypothetical protein